MATQTRVQLKFLKIRAHLVDPIINGRKILQWILKRHDVTM